VEEKNWLKDNRWPDVLEALRLRHGRRNRSDCQAGIWANYFVCMLAGKDLLVSVTDHCLGSRNYVNVILKESRAEPVLPRVSQDELAQMVGTTRSRVSRFMKKFRGSLALSITPTAAGCRSTTAS
jgi:hypothetical protein